MLGTTPPAHADADSRFTQAHFDKNLSYLQIHQNTILYLGFGSKCVEFVSLWLYHALSKSLFFLLAVKVLLPQNTLTVFRTKHYQFIQMAVVWHCFNDILITA